MSRGPGRIEQACLHSFDIRKPEWLTTKSITIEVEIILGREDSPALASSIRRALAALRRKGALQSRKDLDGVVMWTIAAEERKRQQRRQRRAERERRERVREEQERLEQKLSEGFMKRRDKQEQQLARLAKALGMLGSEHDGEVLSAARTAERERLNLGKTWPELLVG